MSCCSPLRSPDSKFEYILSLSERGVDQLALFVAIKNIFISGPTSLDPDHLFAVHTQHTFHTDHTKPISRIDLHHCIPFNPWYARCHCGLMPNAETSTGTLPDGWWKYRKTKDVDDNKAWIESVRKKRRFSRVKANAYWTVDMQGRPGEGRAGKVAEVTIFYTPAGERFEQCSSFFEILSWGLSEILGTKFLTFDKALRWE